jgi:DNA-binding transcriptional ArsR family regulator
MTTSPEPQPAGVLRLDGRALSFGYRLGADALLVLLDLAAHAAASVDGPVVAASYRDIGRRVGLSKDTVGRRIAVLRRTGVVVDRAQPGGQRFAVRCYLLHLETAGIELDCARRRP